MHLRYFLLAFSFNMMTFGTIFGQWTSQKLSSKRNNICSCQVKEKLFFIAGRDKNNNPTKTIDILDLSTNTWTVKQLKSSKSRPECIVIDGKIYVSGGSNNAVDSKVLEILDEEGNSLRTITKPNVSSDLMASLESKLYMVSYDNLDVYDTKNDKWTYFKIPIKREPSLPRDNYAVVALTNQILIAGGNYYGDEYKEVSIFDIRINQWTQDSMSNIRYGLLGKTHDNKAYFIGGQDGDYNYYKTIEIYDEQTMKWELDSLSRGNRFDMSVAIHDEKMFVAGGQVFGAADQFIDLVDVYDFSNKQWSTLKLPTGRSYMTVIGANKNVYFAGGRSDEEDITDIVDIYSLVPISSTETEQTYRLSIFPNPVDGEIILQLPDVSPSDVVQYQIYNSTGMLLLKGELNSSYKIDAHNLIKGNYFIKAFNQQMDRTYVVPFIKI